MTKLRAGIIGLGVGEQHIAGYRRHPECRVAALCDCSASKRAEMAGKYPDVPIRARAEEVLDDPDIDVVSIASHDDDRSIGLGIERIATGVYSCLADVRRHAGDEGRAAGCDGQLRHGPASRIFHAARQRGGGNGHSRDPEYFFHVSFSFGFGVI